MTREEIEKKRKYFNDELKKLQQEEEELNVPEQELAEIIHKALCHWNHGNPFPPHIQRACGWYYEKWPAPKGGSRDIYVQKAKKIFKAGYSIITVKTILDIVKDY